MFVSYQNFFAVPLVVYEHVYEVSSLYYIGKLGFQNPCFSTDSREIEYIYISTQLQHRSLSKSPLNHQLNCLYKVHNHCWEIHFRNRNIDNKLKK